MREDEAVVADPLLRADRAPEPRTLIDIITRTADTHPDEPALDNGAEVLTYSEFLEAARTVADVLHANGVGSGDRVGIRLPSGTTDLYVAILGAMLAGAAYVPVDFDDPDERAQLVFGEAEVTAIIGRDLTVSPTGDSPEPVTGPIEIGIELDAWVIFTSGSTGKPKGVAVPHRCAAAFVDAERRLFLQDRPIGPGDRVMAGLSVAFDASCEEMWLAWAYGACLVTAPRSLVKSGVDLGPWLTKNRITIVSTVPTLVQMWPTEALDRVRLLILGGEACPPEIGARLATTDREVWNTYGPTEATVVACAARLTGEPPVRIGLPLDGWDLAVVDGEGNPVPDGGDGELIIGGVGLAHYLDPVKDREKYAPMASLGWDRAYRSGDLVRRDPRGLLFLGRADDQIKLNGRRIELGEIDSALLTLPGVEGAAAAIRKSDTGNSLLVGYVTVTDGFDLKASTAALREAMPAAMVPRLAVVDSLPTRTSGKIDRDALPWPLPSTGSGQGVFTETEAWIAELWQSILGTGPDSVSDDFFDLGGGSLTAAQLVSRLRTRHPEVTVADVYATPTLGALAAQLADSDTGPGIRNEDVTPIGRRTQLVQVAATIAVRAVAGLRLLIWLGIAALVVGLVTGGSVAWLPNPPWWVLLIGWLLLISPWGRMGLAALAARALTAGIGPGAYPRGGRTHLRIWAAELVADELGATNLANAGWIRTYARWLGCRIGAQVDLHSLPPVTGHLRLGRGAAVESEVDLRGHWIDGNTVHVGKMRVGPGARIGARSTLLPGADVGPGAEVAPGSAIFGVVPADEAWSGAPATRSGAARGPWSERPKQNNLWAPAYNIASVAIALLPGIAILAGIAVAAPGLVRAGSIGAAAGWAYALLIPASIVGYLVLMLLILGVVRLLSLRLHPGPHPVLGRQAWQAWGIIRLLDEARGWLFGLYASTWTPTWLRALGARIGKDVEASTTLMIPSLVQVGDGSFLADDTLIGGYELGGGWLRVERVKIGKRAFVGNSGMAAPGRKVPKQGLVAVLSAAPRRTKAKKGSSWLGSPPQQLRRETGAADESRTYAPPARLKRLRALVELCRIVPAWVNIALHLAVVFALAAAWQVSPWLAVLLGAPVLVLAGLLAGTVTVAAKWLLVGRIRPSEYPLWSSMVWRNELADTFTEVLALPWLIRGTSGTPVLTAFLRAMGARIGRGVWCETYWLPEPDLIRIGAGATIDPGCVVQTHLFHDRVLSMDTVTLGAGATLGPNSVILPAAEIGAHATVGPASLVMRGESIPEQTRWIGNPVGPWLTAQPGVPKDRSRKEPSR
ncbi:amino acid adenylation protein [Enemella evansiae]|nr:amino acid adenylation protein [Enemella evansiae]